MTFEGENMCFFYWTVKQPITKIWKGLNLQTSKQGIIHENLDTKGILLPNTPPLCRAKAYLTQPMHLMVFTPIATSFNHAAYSML